MSLVSYHFCQDHLDSDVDYENRPVMYYVQMELAQESSIESTMVTVVKQIRMMQWEMLMLLDLTILLVVYVVFVVYLLVDRVVPHMVVASVNLVTNSEVSQMIPSSTPSRGGMTSDLGQGRGNEHDLQIET